MTAEQALKIEAFDQILTMFRESRKNEERWEWEEVEAICDIMDSYELADLGTKPNMENNNTP